FLHLAETRGLPRVVSIQNPYSLLNRTFEIGLAEIAIREQAGLLAYSPLAFGVLTGKYLAGRRPQGARLSRFDRFVRYTGENAERAAYEYVTLAHRNGLDPSQLAIAYVLSRPFVTCAIIGATSLEQLRIDIGACELELSPELIADIDAIHARYPNPAP
ncbi:MAG: aldo/keto reductase, partial [Zoogloea sp.]|nr:aldo/keto reductase [Zoogloea sp.]